MNPKQKCWLCKIDSTKEEHNPSINFGGIEPTKARSSSVFLVQPVAGICISALFYTPQNKIRKKLLLGVKTNEERRY